MDMDCGDVYIKMGAEDDPHKIKNESDLRNIIGLPEHHIFTDPAEGQDKIDFST